jgi:dTMP kinase
VSGRYVAVEGVEGAGKSTVVAGVGDRLEALGREVVTVREPGGTDLGEEIRRLLLHGPEMTSWAEAQLFAAQRSQLAADVIRPALARGAMVLGDRSVYSSLAYQGHARGLGVDRVRDVNEAGLGGTWPDTVVLLRIDPGTGLARQAVADRIGAEGADFQRRVAAGFDALADAEPDRFLVVDVDDADRQGVVEAVLARLGVV